MSHHPARRRFLKATSAKVVSTAIKCIQGTSPLETVSFPEDFKTQNTMADQIEIDGSLDAMAMVPSRKDSPTVAWETIFRTSRQSWNQTTAAIKINEVEVNKQRTAIIHKICRVLNTLGIPLSNSTIYGGANMQGTAMSDYKDFLYSNLPAGILVSNYDSALGGGCSYRNKNPP
jgi:hypothetical protein